MTIQLEQVSQCEWCEHTMPTYGTGRPRRFCSDVCRDSAYKQRKATMPGRNEKRCPDCYLVHAGECI
jgi:hypothetical protein